jgi:hypothetical protein
MHETGATPRSHACYPVGAGGMIVTRDIMHAAPLGLGEWWEYETRALPRSHARRPVGAGAIGAI